MSNSAPLDFQSAPKSNRQKYLDMKEILSELHRERWNLKRKKKIYERANGVLQEQNGYAYPVYCRKISRLQRVLNLNKVDIEFTQSIIRYMKKRYQDERAKRLDAEARNDAAHSGE